jgi:sugar phosphate isomerase/epimerase
VNTYSLPELPLDEAIRTFAGIGFGMAELHPFHVEPSFGLRGGRGGAPPTPEQRGSATEAREKLRQWRLTVPLSEFEATGRKFKAAGLYLYAYNMNFRDDFTDQELDRAFQMTRALGTELMTAVGSKNLFRRLDPFAQKYKIWVAVHNEGDSIPTIADFDDVLKGASPYTQMTLDIGHFVASNSDPVACLAQKHDKILNLHIKDRKRSNGPNMPFGEGDTPIKEVLRMNRDRKYFIPVQVEWEVGGPTRAEAVKSCFEYCKQVLSS